MHLDPVLLARLQFAFTISFHIIFPTFTIGIAIYLATLEVLWGWTGAERYKRLAAFWTKIFAVSFAMGVVSGVVLSYQFGTNWSRFSAVAGNVVGPLLGYEVLGAFFLEASFLGILLFGGERVPRWLHVFSALMVALGTSMSAFWILSANSWMQTPAGYTMEDGIAYPADWWAIIFNPSFPYRLAHMLNASLLTGGFVGIAVGARYLLAGRHSEEARTMLRMAIGLTAVLAPLQLLIGDMHAENTLKYQPTKIAAMEGHWDGSKPAPFEILAWPDESTESNLYAISLPHIGSLLVTRQWDGLFPGLNDVPPQDRPPVPNVFFGFRIMVGIGLYMIAAAWFGALAMVARAAIRDALVSASGGAHLVGRLCRRHFRLGRQRKRPAAVDRGRHFAHCGCGLAGAGGQRCDHIDPLRPGLRRRVLVRRLLHQPADRPRHPGNTAA